MEKGTNLKGIKSTVTTLFNDGLLASIVRFNREVSEITNIVYVMFGRNSISTESSFSPSVRLGRGRENLLGVRTADLG